MISRISLVAGFALLLLVAAGCDNGGYQEVGNQNQAASGPVTGLLIVAQSIEGETVDVAHKTVATWNVVDTAGTKIFGKDQISAAGLQKGVKYDWHRAKIFEGSSMWLGKNYKEFHVSKVTVSGPKEAQTATLMVGPAEAAELRAIPNLDTLVRNCNIAILLGKIGQ